MVTVMKNKTRRLETVLLVLLFVLICLCLVLMMTGRISLSDGLLISAAIAILGAGALWYLHRKESAYGGAFHRNFPDAHH